MDNKDPLEAARAANKALCNEQGGTSMYGKDPHAKHEEPRQGSGHTSASSDGVSGKEIPGGK